MIGGYPYLRKPPFHTSLRSQAFDWIFGCAGNAEVERAQQAARQAELLASEAKKGEVEEKHKTELLACFVSGRHTNAMLVTKQLSFSQVGLSSKLKTYVRTRYKALVGPTV